MNQPWNMGNSPMMMGPHFPQGGLVTLDPDFYPGQVTLDPGHPYQSQHRTEGVQNMHSMHHHHSHYSHHCHCHKPKPCPCPPPPPQPITYVVKQGDSVYKIAQKFGTTMQAIILANNLSNPDLIFPGQVFIIPIV